MTATVAPCQPGGSPPPKSAPGAAAPVTATVAPAAKPGKTAAAPKSAP
ncbi:MAG: hypothetical protein IPO15_03630 [Anaerolineae bacterium]|nr:hypothetical protein [Anaerolineae bacterium]